jgi:threonine dehydratase
VNALEVVRGVMPPTPLDAAPALVASRPQMLLKREDLGPNGAFKWRGALCACLALREDGAGGVVTSSTGNHGAATAWATARLGMEAHVVVPSDASERKCALIAGHGARLHRHGATLDDAADRARALASELGLPFLEDGASEAQLAGTATIATELAGADADVVVVPLACGALAGGLARELKRLPRPPWIVGVQSTAFPRLGALWHGEPDPGISDAISFAGGLADSRIVEPAFGACKAHLDDVVAVDDEALRAAIRVLHSAMGVVVEGAGAAPLAALAVHGERIPEGRTVLVLSGANLDEKLAAEILEA